MQAESDISTFSAEGEPPGSAAVAIIVVMEDDVRTVKELALGVSMLLDAPARGVGLDVEECLAALRVARLLHGRAAQLEAEWERAFRAGTGRA